MPRECQTGGCCPGIAESPTGDFVIVGEALGGDSLTLPGVLPGGLRVGWGEGAVVVPRDVMLAWVESWADARIDQYLRGSTA